MTLFERIHVKGFRRLADVDLPLRPLCVLIGANGSGKTSLLDVFSLLAASAAGNLKTTLSDMHGMAANITIDRARQMSMNVPDYKPLVYELSLAPSAVAYEIAEETLSQDRGHPSPFKHFQSSHAEIRYYEPSSGLIRPTWQHNPLETSLAQVPKLFPEPEDFRQRLGSSTHYHVLNVDPRSPVRLPQPLQPATLPGANGEDLVSCLFYLRETDRDRFDAVEDTLRAGFRGFD